jgi:DNA-binding NarL/FixJ family response regulator
MDARRHPGYTEAGWELDVSDLARAVRCPTLIFHATRDQAMPLDEGRSLAALIPGSRFVPVESDNHLPLESDADCPAVMSEVKAFLGLDEPVDKRHAPHVLTTRQVEVLRLVAGGRTDKEIARALNLSPRTVEMHVSRAMDALRCRSRAEAVRAAMERRILD